MKNLPFLFLLGILFTLSSCSKNNDQENMPELNQIFQLKILETANFTDLNLAIRADRVVEDNRCPANVDCIIAGWVTVLFNVEIEGTSLPVQVTLDPDKPQDAEAEVGAYTIRLVTVNPYPQNSDVIAQEDYSFSLVIE